MNRQYDKMFGPELTLEEHKQVQLDILKFVDAFCEKEGLRYYLSDGTLLGAIRHHGYIPWDDDIDIQMPRPDLFKLIETFNKKCGNGRYRLIDPQEAIAQHYMVKIIDTETVKIEPYLNYRHGFLGVDIDVFAMDGCPEDEAEFRRWGKEIRRYNKAYMYRKRAFHRVVLGWAKDFTAGRLHARFVPFLSAREII